MVILNYRFTLTGIGRNRCRIRRLASEFGFGEYVGNGSRLKRHGEEIILYSIVPFFLLGSWVVVVVTEKNRRQNIDVEQRK